jgi:hypothetical protein
MENGKQDKKKPSLVDSMYVKQNKLYLIFRTMVVAIIDPIVSSIGIGPSQ